MDRVRRDPAGIDLGDVFSLGPKPMKSLKETSGTASPQRRPPGSAAASSFELSDLGSQLEGLGGLSGRGLGSSTPAKRQTNASGQSTYQLDPFAELSLDDKPVKHRPMASRGASAQQLFPEPVSQRHSAPADDDPFGGLSTPQHLHTASASSAAAPSAAAPQPSPSGDDPFSLWGEPPPQPQPQAARQPRSSNSAVADDLLEQFTAGASPTPPQQAASHGADDTLLDGFITSSPGPAVHSAPVHHGSGFDDFAPAAAPQHQQTASYGSDGFDAVDGPAIWDSSSPPAAEAEPAQPAAFVTTTHAVAASYADAEPPSRPKPASPPPQPSVRKPSRGRPAGFDPRAAAGGFQEGFIDESDFGSSPRDGNPFGGDGGPGSSHSSPRRRPGSDRGHMSIGSLGSLGSSSARSPRSRDGSPTSGAEPGGSDSVFASAYQAHQEEARRGAPADVREQATRYLGIGSKWIRNSATRIAKAAKEKIDELDIQAVVRPVHHGRSSSQDASRADDTPDHYYQWAATLADMPPDQRATMLDHLPEDDRLIVQRILDTATITSQQRKAVEEASSRVHDMSPRRVASPRQPGSASDAGSAASSPRQPVSRRPGASEEGSRLSRAGRAPPPAYDDIVQDSQHQPPAHQSQRSREDLGSPSDAAAEANAAIEQAQARRRAQATAQRQQQPQQQEPQQRQQQEPQRWPAPAARPVPSPAKRAPPPADADLLGVGGSEAPQPSTAAPAALAEPNLASVDDLGVFFGAPAQPPPAPAAASSDGMDMFTARPSPAANGHAAAQQRQQQRAAPRPAPRPASAPGKGPVLDDRPVEGEPEVRRLAREKRLAAKQSAIDAARNQMQTREAAAEAEKAQKVDLRDQIKPKMDAWSKGKQDNIRALLSTLHTVLWANSGWKPPGLTDLVEASKVKRCYMKANLVVHPDKVKQKGGSIEQVVTADIAFDILKVAWGRFEEGELRGGGSRGF